MEQIKDSNLTICSVYHSQSAKKLLELNSWLTEELNPGIKWKWFVANNTKDRKTKGLDQNKFFEIEGVDRPQNYRKWLRNSYHHIGGLNNLLGRVKSRFFLHLDPDLYIVRTDWIQNILSHMVRNELSFFGVPWHPRYPSKIRYFPAHHSLFVDLSKIDLKTLDFTPTYDFSPKSLPARARDKFYKMILGRRNAVGSSRDVGYKIYEKYRTSVRYECPKPTFTPKRNFIEKFLPDKISLVPKNKDYYSEIKFKDLNHFDADSNGWEEFIWKGEPFAFHVRGSHKGEEEWEREFKLIEDGVKSFSRRIV